MLFLRNAASSSTGAKDDPKSSSRNVFDFPFLSSGTIKKACNTESEMKHRNLTKVGGCGELFARLIKYPAEIRRNTKIKPACASWRLGWQTARPDRNNWPTCLSSIYCETGKLKDRAIPVTTGPTL